MGFKFSDVISGAAKAGADIYGDKLKEQKAERSAFSSKMWNSNAMIQEGASNILKDRNKENQRLQDIRSTFMGRDPDLTKTQMEVIYRLSDKKREELFNAPGSPLLTEKDWNISDLITILEEPEPLDPNLSLVERVQGATKDSPMDYSAFYGQSEHMTVEAEASIAKKQGAQIAAITGISMEKAQSLYSYNFKKVREIKHSINYVTRDYRTEQDFEAVALDLTMKKQGVLGNSMQNAKHKSTLIDTEIASLRANYAASGSFKPDSLDGEAPMSTTGANVSMLSQIPGFESAFKETTEYKEAVKEIISKAAMFAKENPTLGSSQITALNISLPGRYGGDVPKDISKSEDNTYYWLVGKTADGTDQPGVMLGREIKGRAKKALTNKAKGENPQFEEWWGKDNTGSNKVVTKITTKVSSEVAAAKAALKFGEDNGASEESILQLKQDIVDAESDNERDIRDDDRDAFKLATKKKEAVSKITFEPDSARWSTWDKNLDVAIESDDPKQVQLVIDFVTKNRTNKAGGSNMSLPNRLFRRAHEAKNDMRYRQNPTLEDMLDQIDSVLPGSLGTRPNRISSEDAKAFLKKLATYPDPENTDDLAELNKVKKELYRNI